MDVLDKAITFATEKHSGQNRKFGGTPYILHPLEVAAIIATMTDDREVMAAGVLHDTVEDCGVALSDLEQRFGSRVARLVGSETENKYRGQSPESTWRRRKEESLAVLAGSSDVGVKMLWLADKLSNLRSFCRQHDAAGDAFWQRLHNRNKDAHKWYYTSVRDLVTELGDTAAYKEYAACIKKLFE